MQNGKSFESAWRDYAADPRDYTSRLLHFKGSDRVHTEHFRATILCALTPVQGPHLCHETQIDLGDDARIVYDHKVRFSDALLGLRGPEGAIVRVRSDGKDYTMTLAGERVPVALPEFINMHAVQTPVTMSADAFIRCTAILGAIRDARERKAFADAIHPS